MDMSAAGTDPLALIIGGGGSAIGALSLLVWSMLLARVTRLEKDNKELLSILTGSEGFTVKITKLEGKAEKHESEIAALKAGTLSKERFDDATRDQNRRLEELKGKASELDDKVDKIAAKMPRTYSPYPSSDLPGPPKPPGRPYK